MSVRQLLQLSSSYIDVGSFSCRRPKIAGNGYGLGDVAAN
jgi:hypothetical protein